jgi:transposase
MKVYLGIDWSESKHDFCWMNEAGSVVSQSIVKHDADGFVGLDASRAKLGIDPQDCRVGIETAHNLLIDFLWSRGYSQVYVIPPHVIKASRGRFGSSGARTDASDARLIADVVRTDRAKLTLWQPDGALVRQMRASVSLLIYLQRDIVRQSNRLRDMLRRYYPAALTVFSELTTQIALQFILRFPTPRAAAALSLEDFKDFARQHRYPHPKKLEVYFQRLHQPHPQADLVTVLAYESQAKLFAQTLLERVQSRLAELRRLNELFNQHPDADLFRSLPGVGDYLAPALLTKFGDHRDRFQSAAGLQALAGSCPVTEISGKHRAIFFRKACDHEFRHIVQQWAINSLSQSEWALAYFNQICSRSHSASHAHRCLANRWLAIAFSVWQSRKPYDETYHLQQRLARSKPRA